LSKVRILVADESEFIRNKVRSALSQHSDLQIVTEASTAADLLYKVSEFRPQIVIVDIALPSLGGVETVRKVQEMFPDTKIIVLSLHDGKDLIGAALEVGVRGYLMKSDFKRKLAAAVHAACSGLFFCDQRVSKVVLEGYLMGSAAQIEVPAIAPRLTDREIEVVRFLARGYSNRQIAAYLRISVRTAECHRANIMRKLNFRTLVELIHFAIANRIVQIHLHPAAEPDRFFGNCVSPGYGRLEHFK